MTIFDMLGQSAIITVLGMAVVFAFILIMIVCVDITGKLINIRGREKDLAGPKNEVPQTTAGAVHHVAAITAAIAEHQKGE